MTSGGLGTMGYGLPASIGVQIAHPDALVINVAGEASLADEHAGDGDRGAVPPAGQAVHPQQRAPRHGPPVAGAAARRALLLVLVRGAARLRQARRRLRRQGHPLHRPGEARRRHHRDARAPRPGHRRLRGREARELLPDDPVAARPTTRCCSARTRPPAPSTPAARSWSDGADDDHGRRRPAPAGLPRPRGEPRAGGRRSSPRPPTRGAGLVVFPEAWLPGLPDLGLAAAPRRGHGRRRTTCTAPLAAQRRRPRPRMACARCWSRPRPRRRARRRLQRDRPRRRAARSSTAPWSSTPTAASPTITAS